MEVKINGYFNQPKVSIILLNYNGAKFSNLWESLYKVDYSNYEIIFVDNGSSDNSIEKIKELKKKNPKITTRIIKIKNNVGYSRGNNIGLKYTTGKYVVLLSNDIEVDKYWLKNMIYTLEKNPDIAVAQSAMYYLYDKNMRDYQCNYIDVIGFCHVPSLTNEIEDVFYSEGAVMFIRKSVIKEVGGLFDPDHFMFDEDIDFCWRVRLRGYRVCVVKSSIVYHARGGTVPGVVMKTNPFYVYLITKNKIATYYKNLNSMNVIKYIPLLISAMFAKSMWLIYKGKKEAGYASLLGIIDFFKELKKNHSKRLFRQKIRKVPDSVLFKYIYPLSMAFRGLNKAKKKVSKEWKSN